MENKLNDSTTLLKKRPISTAKLRTRPQTSYNSIAKLNIFNATKSNDPNLDVLQLILRTSPVKYDLNSVGDKLKKLNEFYKNKRKYSANFSKTDELYYKYNALYGSKSNNLIRAYSPKMRPVSASVSNFKREIMKSNCNYKVLNENETRLLFESKCNDLKILPKENLERKFYEYCNIKCINRCIDFSECNLGINSAEVLSRVISTNNEVAHLKLAKNNFTDIGIEMIMKAIQNSVDVISIDLSSNDLTHKGGDIIFSTLMDQHSVVSLNLSSLEGINRNRISSEGVRYLESVLQVNQFLEFLNLSGNSIKNEGFDCIIKGLNNNQTLHALNLSCNDISFKGIQQIPDMLKLSKLVELDLSLNPLKDESMDILGRAMNSPSLSSLKRLNLSNCECKFVGIFNLFVHIQSNSRLESLNISNNNMKSEKISQLRLLISASYLKELKMVNCRLGNFGSYAIGEGMLTNNSIRSLDISKNKIGDRGFEPFVNLPLRNFTIESLDFSRNFISDHTAQEFAKNLTSNTNIKRLNFFDNQIQNETGSALITALRTNKNILSINLKYNRVQVKMQDEIQKLVKSNIEKSKLNHIPNLKKEIKANYVNQSDFEMVEIKIEENKVNVKNLTERLSEDIVKYATLKQEEEEALNLKEEENNKHNEQLKEIEENLRKIMNEMKMIQISFNTKSEDINNQILSYYDKVKAVEKIQKELRGEQEKNKIQYEVEMQKLRHDLKVSEDKLTLAQLSAESLKRDLDSKMSLLERLNNPQIEHRNSKVLKSQIVGSPVRTLQNSSSQARLIEESKISNQLMEERAKVDHSTENKSKSKQKKKTKAKKETKVKKQTKIKPSSIK